MRKPLLRIAAGLVGGLVAMLAVAPGGLAFAAEEVETVEDVVALDEAWFFRFRQPLAPVPDIEDPTNNNPDDIGKATVRERTNPYPGDTLHVGVNGGDPEAEAFLAWDLLTLNGSNGLYPKIVGGTVTFTDAGTTCISSVPDSAPEGARPPRSCGSRNVESAEMVGCPATTLIVEAQGGDWADKYDYDTKQCAPLEPVEVKEGEPAQWTLKLDQWKNLWSDPFKSNGIAIVPNPDIAPPAPEEWHVAFHGRRTDAPDATLITADLKIIKQDFDIPDAPDPDPEPSETYVPPTDDTTSSSGDSGSSYTPPAPSTGSSSYTPPTTSTSTIPSSTTPATTGTTTAPPAQAAPPVASTTPVVAPTQPVSAPTTPPTPMAIWLLPVLGLSLAGALGWSLTRPVELATEREGAVSKLMKARRLGRATA